VCLDSKRKKNVKSIETNDLQSSAPVSDKDVAHSKELFLAHLNQSQNSVMKMKGWCNVLYCFFQPAASVVAFGHNCLTVNVFNFDDVGNDDEKDDDDDDDDDGGGDDDDDDDDDNDDDDDDNDDDDDDDVDDVDYQVTTTGAAPAYLPSLPATAQKVSRPCTRILPKQLRCRHASAKRLLHD
jgi:hypothetical protein